VTEGFDIALRTRGGTARLILSGDLDLAAVSDLRAAFARVNAEPACGIVLVDLGRATFIDSTIIGVLEAGRQAVAERDRTFVATHARGLVKRALVVAGLEAILDAAAARNAPVVRV
jgi:anti-anti-sigma factor